MSKVIEITVSKTYRHGGAMEFIGGENHNQILLLPDSIEDYVDGNNAV
jgi:hypothetical protein